MHHLPQVTITARPEEVRTFPFGRFELFSLGGQQFGRAVYAPGWRWSEHVAPLAGAPLCEVEHVGLVVAGRAAVRMADGTEVTLGPGDFFSIAPGHDSWVLDDEEYVSLHLLGAQHYAATRPDPAPARTRAAVPVGQHNATHDATGQGCEGWTLLSDPLLHVLRERMPPGTSGQRHRHERTVQLYFVLSGTAAIEVAGTHTLVNPGEGIEIPAAAPHLIRNDASDPLEFLVASSQPPRSDRLDLASA